MQICVVFFMILLLLPFSLDDDHLAIAVATHRNTSSYNTDQAALLALKAYITYDPYNSLARNWSSTTPVCSWIGVSCDPILHRVTYLDLSNMGLQGTIPPHIANLSFLAVLDLSNNSFSGEIPSWFGSFHNLSELHLYKNHFSGSLLDDMFEYLPNLQGIDLSNNLLVGRIPSSLWKCKNLYSLFLDGNKFSGSIPKDLANLTLLEKLSLQDNHLTGTIPDNIGELRNLELLLLDDNAISGSIPTSLMNCTSLWLLGVRGNRLAGTLPTNIGELHNLEGVSVFENEFHGNIPSSIGNASKLSYIGLGVNAFSGSVPNSVSNLRELTRLDLEINKLSGDISFISSLASCKNLKALILSYNLFNSTIPASIGNLSSTTLSFLNLQNCRLKGKIPGEVGNLKSLIELKLGGNKLSGSVPTSVGRLERLQHMDISYNGLEGRIPDEICHLRYLFELYLGFNNLVGHIPGCIGDMTSLRRLGLDSNNLTSSVPSTFWSLDFILDVSLSSNSLTGELPLDIGKLKVIFTLDLSSNHFSGVIPSTMGGLQFLTSLSLANNKLQSHIPDTFGNLISMEDLDLSGNNLSGEIPKSLEMLTSLHYLNLSFNMLQGQIPRGGTFRNFSVESFLGNSGLCSTFLPRFPACKSNLGTSKTSVLKFILSRYILPASILTITAFVLVWLRCRRRSDAVQNVGGGIVLPTWNRISYLELVQATDGFCESNLIGNGGFGSVYKGTFPDGTEVAVKVFNLQQEERALRSFDVECELMSNIRHRNLVKIISSCSNLEFKALILEYMPHGSLDKWLYSHNYFLDILQRLNIMIDVASALQYLHHGCLAPIIHCDLKPSNILLDGDMIAHVSDLGIAELLGEGDSMTQTRTLATIGYMSPEYGSEGIVSTDGDVYSFGIVLMETFTRKKPTDEIFNQGMSLRNYVKDALPDAVTEVADANLMTREQHLSAAKKECIHDVFGLAMDCTMESPEGRPHMNKVLAVLKSIRIKYHANVITARAGGEST